MIWGRSLVEEGDVQHRMRYQHSHHHLAITEGNTDQATKSQKQFKKYLGRDPLNKILQTQIQQTKDLKIINVEKGAD